MPDRESLALNGVKYWAFYSYFPLVEGTSSTNMPLDKKLFSSDFPSFEGTYWILSRSLSESVMGRLSMITSQLIPSAWIGRTSVIPY